VEEELGPHVQRVGPFADDQVQQIAGGRFVLLRIWLRSLIQVCVDHEQGDVIVEPNQVDQEVSVTPCGKFHSVCVWGDGVSID
jgi:hypothetical protein